MVTSRNAVDFVNIHPQKSKWVTAKIILVSPASILVGEWLQRQRHIGAWPLYILFKCDVRHRLHCFVCTDTHLFNFTKGKTDLVNQRWRRTTCLKHQCYDVGCYPWRDRYQATGTVKYHVGLVNQNDELPLRWQLTLSVLTIFASTISVPTGYRQCQTNSKAQRVICI